MEIKVDLEMLKDKITENKESKKEELAKKLEVLASMVRNKDVLDDTQIRNIMQNLLDYRKCCVASTTIEAVTCEDESDRMDLILQLL